jgi:UDP-glucose 6-dehydrogenase
MAAAIASRGFYVIGVDVSHRAVELVNAGHAPVQETNLEETIAANRERLRATLSHREVILNSEVPAMIEGRSRCNTLPGRFGRLVGRLKKKTGITMWC